MPASSATRCVAALSDRLLHADFRWELDGRWHALPLGEPAGDLEAAFPDARSFGLLSAAKSDWATSGGPPTPEGDRALQQRLHDLRLRHRPASALSAQRLWKLHGWLVLDPGAETFDRLTDAFDQAGGLFWLRGAPVRLRLRGPAPADAAGHPAIDWIDAPETAEGAFAAPSP